MNCVGLRGPGSFFDNVVENHKTNRYKYDVIDNKQIKPRLDVCQFQPLEKAAAGFNCGDEHRQHHREEQYRQQNVAHASLNRHGSQQCSNDRVTQRTEQDDENEARVEQVNVV